MKEVEKCSAFGRRRRGCSSSIYAYKQPKSLRTFVLAWCSSEPKNLFLGKKLNLSQGGKKGEKFCRLAKNSRWDQLQIALNHLHQLYLGFPLKTFFMYILSLIGSAAQAGLASQTGDVFLWLPIWGQMVFSLVRTATGSAKPAHWQHAGSEDKLETKTCKGLHHQVCFDV